MKRKHNPSSRSVSSQKPRTSDAPAVQWTSHTFTNPKWRRRVPPPLNRSTDSIIFQQIEVDYHLGYKPGSGVHSGEKDPIIRMYGITRDGDSILANILGFVPYFYVPAPSGFDRRDCDVVQVELNKRMRAEVTHQGHYDEYVQRVSVEMKQSIYGFSDEQKPFLRIDLASPRLVPKCRDIFEKGLHLPRYGDKTYHTFESNIPYILRYMIDRDVVGVSWVEVPAGTYELLQGHQGTSTCSYEINVRFDQLIAHQPADEWLAIAPLRMVSFDIECAGRKGHFPDPQMDPVIQIASYVTRQGSEKPFVKTIFTLNDCTPIVGAEVCCFKTESELLMGWSNFIRAVDPDIITGYNINNFDFPYLIDRAHKLKLDQFPLLGRIKGQKSVCRDQSFQSKQTGRRENKETSMTGRVMFDALVVIQRNHKLRSYTLNNVSAQFLGEQKESVHHSIITTLQNGTADDRRRLAVYCLKDAYLPQRLLDKLMHTINYIEMARVTGVPLGYLLTRGQQIKVLSKLYRNARRENLLVPVHKIDAEALRSSAIGYEGATVIEPKRGYYSDPVATLDFSSLYPSIMMAHNLCYSTLVHPSMVGQMKPEDVTRSPTGDVFVKAHVKRGLLPRILTDLLSARKQAKRMMAAAKDPFEKAVYNGRQLALKVTANSVYGFTGAQVGKLPCLEISASVTSYGREMIELTKNLVVDHYTIANGYAHDAEVIYGDTDSVMVRFGMDDVAESMRLGKEAAEMVTKHFVKPINLEFEKVYYPYLLMNKKRYAGLYWDRPDKYSHMDCKGIESVRRDNCPLVKIVLDQCLDKILIERDIEGAQEYVKQMISDLLCNRLDLSLLVISKSYSKSADAYANKQPHVELALRMKKRDPGNAPVIGDRVPYVIRKAPKGTRAFEKSEDPLYVLEHNIPLDTHYYLENQLAKPLTRLFKPLMKDPGVLLHGDHTRRITVVTPSSGGIVGFTTKRLTCMSCKGRLEPHQRTTCTYCAHLEGELYQTHATKVNKLEREFAAAWTQCQRCQGSLHQEVLCTSRDCPIFYMRKKIQKDLGDAVKDLERFSFSW